MGVRGLFWFASWRVVRAEFCCFILMTDFVVYHGELSVFSCDLSVRASAVSYCGKRRDYGMPASGFVKFCLRKRDCGVNKWEKRRQMQSALREWYVQP